jgi:hypothetical protein
MLFQILFTAIFFAALAYGTIAGGRTGKSVSLILLLAALATIPASIITWNSSFLSWPILLVDLLCFLALLSVAFKSDKLWPLWLAGLQLCSVASHIAVIMVPANLALIYDAINRFWSIPMLLIMVFGIHLDRRQSKRK